MLRGWKEITKEFPVETGIYLTLSQHINYPYNLSATYFDGDNRAFLNKGVLPITHWMEVPDGPDSRGEGAC